MDQIRKAKIKQVMIDTLTKNVNYPNCSEADIHSQLKPMWIALEECHLTDGLSYKAFQEHASNQAMLANFSKILGI